MSPSETTLAPELADTYREALMVAIREIFGSMMSERVSCVDRRTADPPHISSLIGLAGNFSGVLALHFSESAACLIASKLLGMKLVKLDETVRDAIAELANMVAGGFKKSLSREQEMFKVSIPSVVQGLKYATRGSTHSRQLWFGAAADTYAFDVQLIVEVKEKG